MKGVFLPARSRNAIRFTHVGILAPSVRFRLVAVKPMILCRCEEAIAVPRRHDRFGKNPKRMGTGVSEARVPVVVRRTDGARERIVSVPKSMFVFLIAYGAPNRVNHLLVLGRLWSKVRAGWTIMRPHDWLVVFWAPFGRGRQRSSSSNGLERDASQLRVP